MVAITDALVVAYILNATLLVLKLGQKLFWKDSRSFSPYHRYKTTVKVHKSCFLKGLISWVIRLVAFNLGYLPGGDKTIIRVRNNTEEGIGSCKKYRGAWRSYQFSGLCGASWWMASNPDKIIMAKPAGGPSKRDQHAGMDED
ncbi:S-adenosyl-L-methionine-dependent methyltransferases superfamily protein [Prunus dulcis]|uniref:S-adenosyl-L-methionine-dependent methyltransferases superfamily protein n=1 Tax=Prunus dulcis TaxID=3755 RepID=A0A5H2XTS4_PRUDU|nr:S-adenosyl-L-methionine-dependent methyltransferases superfamily protein [Prunus dulcis]